jgi:hypothetical protein
MEGMRLRWWLKCGAVVILIALLGVAYSGRALPQGPALSVSAQAGTRLAIDADITNGSRPCDPIDNTATVAVGSVHKVGVCIEDYVPNSVNSFELHIRYTGDPDASPPTTLNKATEVPDVAPALDDNPDANDGDDPSGFKLGGGWDCTGLGLVLPRGEDPSTPNVADAVIVCNAALANPDQDLSANPGLLATVEFTAASGGDDIIDFGSIDKANRNGVFYPRTDGGAARCATAVAADKVDCVGATIHKGAGGPTPLPGTATPAATPTATPVTGPAATPTPLPPGMEAVTLVAGCNPVASTYPDHTPIQTIASNVGPAGSLSSLWEFELGTWLGYSPQYPEVSDLQEKDFLDVVFVCVATPGALVRPAV